MGVIDEHLREDMAPGDSGAAEDARAVAAKANALGDLVTSGRLSETELNATIGAGAQVAIWTDDRAPGVDVKRFVQPGESFPGDASVNVSPIIQRAYDALRADSRRPPLWLPDGTFRMDTELVMQPSTSTRAVGVIGQGQNRTKLVVSPSTFAGIRGYGDKVAGTAFRNLVLRGFTVDCTAQSGSPTASMKGLNIGHIFDGVVDDVFIDSAWASAFGLDFLVRCVIKNSGGRNAGRGVNKDSLLGFGSTGGFGSGAYSDESLHLIDFTSESAGRMGLNFEWLHDAGEYHNLRVTIENFTSRGDAVGIGDLGNGGINFVSGVIDGFKAAGFVVGPGGQAPVGGTNGYIGPGVTIQNGQVGVDSNPAQDIYGAHGIVFRGEGGGGYVIDRPVIRDNQGSPLYFEPGFRKSPGSLRVAMRAYRNGSGVNWRAGGQMERDVTFAGGHYEENGGAALDLRSSFLGLAIKDNTFVEKNGKQQIAVRFDPAKVVDSPVIDGNRDYDTTTWIDGSAAIVNPVAGTNQHLTTPATDPGLIYFSPLTSFPAVNELGDGWVAGTTGIFTQTHVWERGRYGAEPKDGGAGNSGASLRYRDAGTLGFEVSAIINPRTTNNARRGIVVSFDPVTGTFIVLENFTSFYQWARYDNTGARTVLQTFGDKASTERHEVTIRQPASGTSWTALIDGVEVSKKSTSTLAKTPYVGVFGLAQLDGWVSNLSIRTYTGA